MLEAKNKSYELFVTVHGFLQRLGWGGNEQRKGDFFSFFLGSPQNAHLPTFSVEKKAKAACVPINSSRETD